MPHPAPIASALGSLGWIDLTALTVLLVFFVLGLFRGFFWQLTRILGLLAAYVIAGHYGDAVAARIDHWFSPGVNPNLPLYLAYFGVFLVVLVGVALLAYVREKLRREPPAVSLANRVGGGVLGLGTGACLVLAVLTATLMFFGPGSGIVRAARSSRALSLSSNAVHALGDLVPPALRDVFAEPAPVTTAPSNGEKH